MKQKEEITERDIFKYVFSTDSLPADKRLYLDQNIEKFKSQIEYCLQLRKISLQESMDDSASEVAEKILNNRVIELNPIAIGQVENESKQKLAAASTVLQKRNYSLSFSDKTSDYLIKIVMTDSQNLLYFFSSSIVNKVNVTLLPSGETYSMLNTSIPLDIIHENNIEQIILTII